MGWHELFELQLAELAGTLRRVDAAALDELAEAVATAPRVLVAGRGRSGLIVQAFANRLMHLGKATFVLGDTLTPPVAAGDLVIVGSGSGATASLVVSARAAKQFGARLAVLTIDRRSLLGQLADMVVEVPASSPKLEGRGRGAVSVQPLGTLFEQALALTCDALVSGLMRRLGVSEQAMYARHANVE